ncbi:hypothetical protein CJF31_00003910 [Rutstroemia sp. NJR-2017a BVV2]|nr:hypothetical protein CJF31_00003910 [Rutstroemia sp. NJR-2017a BVV2]
MQASQPPPSEHQSKMSHSASPPASSPSSHYTEPTTNYWQEFLPPTLPTHRSKQIPFQYGYPALLPDHHILMLPIRPLLSNPDHAVASLLVNQASMHVVKVLANLLAGHIRDFEPDVIIGLPTLGLTLAPLVAEKLEMGCIERYVPLGYSRKFWYDTDLSAEVSSITSPELGQKRVYLDPNQLPLVKGKKCVIIDDAVSSGTTLRATWDMLERIGCEVVGCGVVMKQGAKWEEKVGKERVERVKYVIESPLLEKVEGGWAFRS